MESWDVECQRNAEDIETYLEAEIEILKPLADEQTDKAAAFALKNGDRYEALCQINTKTLPGYNGPVLRVRHLTLAPSMDLEEVSLENYSDVLVNLFYKTLEIAQSDDKLKAEHIKFHLPSPSDKQFFAVLRSHLQKESKIQDVRMAGTWLYLTLN